MPRYRRWSQRCEHATGGSYRSRTLGGGGHTSCSILRLRTQTVQVCQNPSHLTVDNVHRHLSKLVTVHGRYNMMRTALMVEYSFYKNLAMFSVQFWFAFYCHFSAQTFYDSWVMAGFNTILVSAPPLCLALFEKDLREDVIFQYPEVYPGTQRHV